MRLSFPVSCASLTVHASLPRKAVPVTAPNQPDSRLRAYGQFLVAIFYFFLVSPLAHHAARRPGERPMVPIGRAGHAGFPARLRIRGIWLRPQSPASIPSPPRACPPAPVGLTNSRSDISIGWGMAVVCVLAMALLAASSSASRSPSSIGDGSSPTPPGLPSLHRRSRGRLSRLRLPALCRATGSAGAVFGFSLLYAFLESMRPGATHSSSAVAFVLAVLLVHCLSPHSRSLGRLGPQLRMEGKPRPALWPRRPRQQLQLPHRSGRPYRSLSGLPAAATVSTQAGSPSS